MLTPKSAQLMKHICKKLLKAPNLRTLKVIWHDRIEHGEWKKKRDCLKPLARLPETVQCAVFLGAEAVTVHFPHQPLYKDPTIPSAQEYAAKADLNRHLKNLREQYQARSRRVPLEIPPQASLDSLSFKSIVL